MSAKFTGGWYWKARTHQSERSWLKAVALENISVIRVTFSTFHSAMAPLKETASLNIRFMLVTLLTSQVLRFWLKESQRENIPSMLVTLLTSQAEMSWLNLRFLKNMLFILVTLLTSHLLMSWLNHVAPRRMFFMSVTWDTHTLVRSPLAATIANRRARSTTSTESPFNTKKSPTFKLSHSTQPLASRVTPVGNVGAQLPQEFQQTVASVVSPLIAKKRFV